MAFVLRNTLDSRILGKPMYFRCMTGIGPMQTSNLTLAARFEDKQEAMQSPAYLHPLSFFEPEPDPDEIEQSEFALSND